MNVRSRSVSGLCRFGRFELLVRAAPTLLRAVVLRGVTARAAFLFPVRDAIGDLPPRALESV
jgi:hypothetical protein